MRQRWVARWEIGETPREFAFDSLSNRTIAGIDFKLKLNSLKEPIPEKFTLEEIEKGDTSGWNNTKAALGYVHLPLDRPT